MADMETNLDCPYFCDRFASRGAEVFELLEIQQFFFMWDNHPTTPGHTLIIPKRHFADFRDISEAEAAELPKAIVASYEYIEGLDLKQLYGKLIVALADRPKAVKYMQTALAQLENLSGIPDGYNHGLNDGRAAGRTIDHMHYHIMPRWTGDMAEPQGGIRHMFPEGGNYQKD